MVNSKGYKIFVSHGTEDSWIACQIGKRIREDCGACTFLDLEDVPSGDNFKQRIQKELHEAFELVALFTPWSAQRSWVWIEVGGAWALQKRVIAVLHGLTVKQFEEIAGGKAVFEDLHITQLNDFDRYLTELSSRVTEKTNAKN